MHLNFGDSGRLNLSKLGPLSRVGTGSGAASGVTGASSKDRGEQERTTGGAAAAHEDSAGGGGPAGGGGGAASGGAAGPDGGGKAGRGGGGKKQPRAGSKPQRTMTHLWKRVGPGQA